MAGSLTDLRPVALITGSGRPRVGRVVAQWLAERDYSIGLHYHASAEAAQAALDQLRSSGVDCEAFQADVSLDRDVDRMFLAASERFGRIDVLVTTASIWETKPLEEVTAADLSRSFNVNTLGTFLCARRAGLMMAEQEAGGSIITVGDWAIKRPYHDHAAYFVAKGAIPTLTRALAVELARRNPLVRVNCIHPGPVMFPPNTSEKEKQNMIDSTLVKNANCPEAVARTVQFFIDNPFISGVCLPVDGGRTIYAGERSSSGETS